MGAVGVFCIQTGAPMKLTLRQQLAQFSHLLQSKLFPVLEEELGELSATARRLIAVLNLIPLHRKRRSLRTRAKPTRACLSVGRAQPTDERSRRSTAAPYASPTTARTPLT